MPLAFSSSRQGMLSRKGRRASADANRPLPSFSWRGPMSIKKLVSPTKSDLTHGLEWALGLPTCYNSQSLTSLPPR